MKKMLVVAFLCLLVVAVASAAVFYPVIDSYQDGSWRAYSVFVEGYEDSPPDAPCRSWIAYGPSWCTSASNCQARAAASPSIPRCAPGGGPYDPPIQ